MELYHRYRQAENHGQAAATLELAMQTPEYRPEAMIWKGINALATDPQQAFIFLSNAAHALPDRADVHALVGRSILAQNRPDLATRYLAAAWQKSPHDLGLRLTLWQARSQSETPQALRRIIYAHLPDITSGKELRLVLKLLAAQADAPATVGVVRYIANLEEMHGWVVFLAAPQNVVDLELSSGSQNILLPANQPHTLLTSAGLPPTHGGIRIKLPIPTPQLQVRASSGEDLVGSPLCILPKFAPPPPSVRTSETLTVDILIPVYDGLEETLECIHSVLTARKLNETPHRVVVLEDASPIAPLVKALQVMAANGKIHLVHRPTNLGFIRNMNRGMTLRPNSDVVWLNADTRVHGNWLDRLKTSAYCSKDVASVTPLTNNGELMSFPFGRVSHPMPSLAEHAELDNLARVVNSAPIELETGCGFCLYIKRGALDAVGYLDEVDLNRGYGEETDWCLRASGAGWRHLGATNVFVAHKGGVSFGEEKAMRVAYNNAILRKRFPDAERRYEVYCKRDPIRKSRSALQRARLPCLRKTIADASLEINLSVCNSTGDKRSPLSLSYHQGITGVAVSLESELMSLPLEIHYILPTDSAELERDLRSLPFQVVEYQVGDHIPPLLKAVINGLARKEEMAEIPSPPTQDCSPPSSVKKLVIVDDLRPLEIINAWLDACRQRHSGAPPYSLLILGGSAAAQALQPLLVQIIHHAPALTIRECLLMAGCKGGLTLGGNITKKPSPALTGNLDLPIYTLSATTQPDTTPIQPEHSASQRTQESCLQLL